MDDKYAKAELFIFISLLCFDATLNYLDSYYYRKIYKKLYEGYDNYKKILNKYISKKESEIE